MKQFLASMSIFHQLRGLRRSETVKARILLLCVAFASAPLLSAQVNCTQDLKLNSSGQPVVGASQGPLVCQYPFSASVLAQATFGGNVTNNASLVSQLATGAAATTTALNAAMAAQLAQLPTPSAAVGTVSLHLPGRDVAEPFSNLGPILTDRPDTVPRKGYFLSFAYQHFNFTQIDGLGFGALNFAVKASGIQVPNAAAGVTGDFYAAMQNKLSFQLDQYIALATIGLSRTTDISVVIPINSVSVTTTSSQFSGFLYSSANSSTHPYIVFTQPGTGNQTPLITSGSATGIGDVTVNVKQMLLGQEGRYAVAAGAQFRFPSGDATNYLGSGAWGANIFSLTEYRGRFRGIGIAPHMKFGYQWNGQSQIMDIQHPPHLSLPGGLDYAFGADFGLYQNLRKARALTLSLDGVGHQYVNAPILTDSPVSLPPVPATQPGISVPSSLAGLGQGTTTYTTFNFSGGFKVQVQRHVLLYANVLVPITNVGLRSDPVPLVGIGIK
jgi:hypothetical protein